MNAEGKSVPEPAPGQNSAFAVRHSIRLEDLSCLVPAWPDSLACAQQKCLVHLVRDIDDDLLRNPFDSLLKAIAEKFGTLLRTIMATVDRYGLKRRHLHKHLRAAERFLDSVRSHEFSSELASKYKGRLQKSGLKLFTFLDHDGVPH